MLLKFTVIQKAFPTFATRKGLATLPTNLMPPVKAG